MNNMASKHKGRHRIIPVHHGDNKFACRKCGQQWDKNPQRYGCKAKAEKEK